MISLTSNTVHCLPHYAQTLQSLIHIIFQGCAPVIKYTQTDTKFTCKPQKTEHSCIPLQNCNI